MATRTPKEKFQAGKRMASLFSIYHEMLKRNEEEAGKGLEKIVYRVVAESFQTRGMYFFPIHLNGADLRGNSQRL